MKPRVVIIGAGFGGLSTALKLADAPVEITLIDRNNYHCFQPLLYQVATAALSPADIAWPIRSIVRNYKNVTVLMATVTDIDLGKRCVMAGAVAIPYDYLVVATGVTHSYFGHEEWAEIAPGLKRIEDATTIRRELLLAFERAELSMDENERKRLLTFIVVGAGPTGVEMAGAIAEVARDALPEDFRRINAKSARVVLIEAGPRILPALPENLSRYAHDALTKMNVEVLTDTKVTQCDPRGVESAKGRIEAGTIVWAAGVVASPAAVWLKAAPDRAGRVPVNEQLSLSGHPDIYVIGDTAAVNGPKAKPVPGIAPAAKQMGNYVAKAIAARVQGKPADEPFKYRHQGDLATIGRKSAVVRLDSFSLKGFIGWLFWSVAHVYFLIGLRNRFVVAFSWFWSYVTFQRSARLITGDSMSEEVSEIPKTSARALDGQGKNGPLVDAGENTRERGTSWV